MFGIEKDFQNLMEQVYGPHYGFGRKVEEESAKIAKQLVDNAVEEVKMTKQTLPDTIEIDGVKYKKVEEHKSKVRTLYDICVEWCDDDNSPPVEQLIDKIEKEWTPLNLNQNRGFTDGYSMGFDDALNMVRKTLR